MIPSVDNVLSVYRASSPLSVSEGMDWYNEAHEFAKTLDPNNVSRAAGIIAALSPMNSWPTNMKGAAKVYAQGHAEGTHTLANVDKANRIFNGEAPLDVLKGNKVRAFYETIFDPTSAESVPVIDRHAFDIAVGKKTDDKARGILGRKGVYDSFAQVYMAAASEAGIGSAQMQAVTWVEWRRIHKITK